jgi:hypothetical protein
MHLSSAVPCRNLSVDDTAKTWPFLNGRQAFIARGTALGGLLLVYPFISLAQLENTNRI